MLSHHRIVVATKLTKVSKTKYFNAGVQLIPINCSSAFGSVMLSQDSRTLLRNRTHFNTI